MSLCDDCFFNLKVSKKCSKDATVYPMAKTCPKYQKERSKEEPRIKRIMNGGGTVVNFYSDMERL